VQALDDISRGLIKVADKMSELRFLKDTGRKMEVGKCLCLSLIMLGLGYNKMLTKKFSGIECLLKLDCTVCKTSTWPRSHLA